MLLNATLNSWDLLLEGLLSKTENHVHLKSFLKKNNHYVAAVASEAKVYLFMVLFSCVKT